MVTCGWNLFLEMKTEYIYNRNRKRAKVKINKSLLIKNNLPFYSRAPRAGGLQWDVEKVRPLWHVKWEQTVIFPPQMACLHPVIVSNPWTCVALYPASHKEVMRSLCASVAVTTNKSSLVRVRGWDVLIALLIWSFAPRQRLINTSGGQGRKHMGLESFSFHPYLF